MSNLGLHNKPVQQAIDILQGRRRLSKSIFAHQNTITRAVVNFGEVEVREVPVVGNSAKTVFMFVDGGGLIPPGKAGEPRFSIVEPSRFISRAMLRNFARYTEQNTPKLAA